MPIDSGPSFPQPSVEDSSSKIEKGLKITEANGLIDVFFDSSFNMGQQDQTFIESNSPKIVTATSMLEEIKYGEPGYEEVCLIGRDTVQDISYRMGQLKTNSEDFGLDKSSREILHSLVDQISETNNSQKVSELSEEAESILKTKTYEYLNRRDEIKKSRNNLVQSCEENHLMSKNGLARAGENNSREIESGNVYNFVEFSKRFYKELNYDAENISLSENSYIETMQEAFFRFSKLMRSLNGDD